MLLGSGAYGEASYGAQAEVTGYGSVAIGIGVAGTAKVAVSAHGPVSLVVGVAGTAKVAVSAHGSTALGIAVAGSAKVAISAHGSVALGVVVAGTATVRVTAQGNVPLPVGVAGSASVRVTGTGNVPLRVVVAGSAAVRVTGSGNVPLGVGVAGVAGVRVTGAGSVPLPLHVAGAAAVGVAAHGTVPLGVGVAGSAGVAVAGAGLVHLGLGVNGLGGVLVRASGSVPLGIGVAGDAHVADIARGDESLSIGVAGSGRVRVTAQGGRHLPTEVDGVGGVLVTGQGVVPLTIGVAGTGTVEGSGSGGLPEIFANGRVHLTIGVHGDAFRSNPSTGMPGGSGGGGGGGGGGYGAAPRRRRRRVVEEEAPVALVTAHGLISIGIGVHGVATVADPVEPAPPEVVEVAPPKAAPAPEEISATQADSVPPEPVAEPEHTPIPDGWIAKIEVVRPPALDRGPTEIEALGAGEVEREDPVAPPRPTARREHAPTGAAEVHFKNRAVEDAPPPALDNEAETEAPEPIRRRGTKRQGEIEWPVSHRWTGSKRWGKAQKRGYWKSWNAFKSSFEHLYRAAAVARFRSEEIGIVNLLHDSLIEVHFTPSEPAGTLSGAPALSTKVGIDRESLERFKDRLGLAYDDYHERWRDSFEEVVTKQTRVVGGSLARDLGVGLSFSVLNPRVRDFIRDRVNLLVGDPVNGGVPERTFRAVMDTILQGIEAGDGTTALAERVRQVFQRGYYRVTESGDVVRVLSARQRARLIARTEVGAVANGAAWATVVESDLTMEKTWVNQGDDRVREEHEDEPLGVGDESVLADEQFSNGLDYPCEPNCRCTLYFELAKDAKTSHRRLRPNRRRSYLATTAGGTTTGTPQFLAHTEARDVSTRPRVAV